MSSTNSAVVVSDNGAAQDSTVISNGSSRTNETVPPCSVPQTKQSTADSSQAVNPTSATKLNYGRVVISLENPILPDDRILNTPTIADGLDPELEYDLRVTGCRLIQISGILLRLPQVAMATGQVLFHRYYYCKSFVRFPMEITAMGCVVLASKVEEAPRRIRDIINVFHNMKQIRLGKPITPMLLDENYVNLKNQVIKSERRILKELGFCVHVKHPHKFIVAVAQILKNENHTELIQSAWSYMNDSLQTNVFVRYPPEAIACACIHLSSRILRVPLPSNPLWYKLFDVDTEAIESICKSILKLYTRRTLSQEELENNVEEARKALDLAKNKARIQQVQTSLQNSENTVTSFDSLTNSPKYPNNENGGANMSKSLEILSVINRLKETKQLKATRETATNQPSVDSDMSVTAMSTPSTPIKLQKSPQNIVKQSLSKALEKGKSNSNNRTDSSDSSELMDYSPKVRSTLIKQTHYKNGNSNNDDSESYYSKDRYSSKYDNEKDNIHRTRSPKSYVSSAVVTSDKNHSKHRSYSRYRHNSRSRSRSPSPYNNDQYSRYTKSSSAHHRSRDEYRDDYTRYQSSRDDRDRYTSDSRHYKQHDDGYRRRSRSPTSYSSSKDRHHKSSRKSKY